MFLRGASRISTFRTILIRPAVPRNTVERHTLQGLVQRLNSNKGHILKYFSRTLSRPGRIITPVLTLALFGSAAPTAGGKAKTMSDRNEMLGNADQLMDESQFQECYDLLSKLEDQNDPNVLWRKGRALQKLSKSADKKVKEEYIRKAYDFLEKALSLDDQNFAIHKWYAILLDCRGELDGIKARVSQLDKVKHHMVRATELNPQDPTSWYILGEFEFGLADMSWYVSKIVSTLFATPPSGSYEKALEYFLKAEEIEPNFYSTNHLMLGKTYMNMKNMDKAKHHLNIAANTRVNNIDDKICKEKAEELLKKL